MNKLDMELEAIHKFCEHMRENIFYTRDELKLDNEIRISKVFPIYIKNPNEFEMEFIMDNNYKQLYSFVSAFPNLKTLMDINIWFLNDIYCAFSRDIADLHFLYEKYLDYNDEKEIKKAIEKNDKKSFCAYLSSLLNENYILIEVKDWKKIDNYICKYYECSKEEVIDADYRIYFIEQYINFFNILNFNLRIFNGISLLEYEKLIFSNVTENKEFNSTLSNVLSNIFTVDSFVENEQDIMNLLFIINNFEENRYRRNRKYIVDIVTCIESILVKKFNDSNNKIEDQFKHKVQLCCQYSDYFIPINELKELYNYRSLIVHGNFNEIIRKTNEITTKKWYIEYSSRMGDDIKSYDNGQKEDLIFGRLFEIFNIIFRLYCTKNSKIKSLKEIVDKDGIKQFKFE